MDKQHKFKIAATFGRFNLLHRGHIDLFVNMAKDANEVWIGLSTGPSNLDYTSRAAVIEKALAPYDINFRVVPARQPFELFELANSMASLDTVCYLGEDQAKLAKAIERAFMFEPRLNPRITSSTTVRALIDNEEWDLLSEIVPGRIISDVINLHLSAS